MNIIKTEIPEVVVIEPTVYGDERGYFFESFSEEIFNKEVRKVKFVQDNESKSTYGVLRGLHYQLPPFAQSKLVRVVKGKVLDVVVDIRRGSPWYGKYVANILSEENKHQMFVPRGFAHGFLALSKEVIFAYKCDNYYAPKYEGAIRYDDPLINIDWGMPMEDIILSDKDKVNPLLNGAELFDYKEDLYE
jgi:dTDP-4-dehydrorhamnose 3,5-epimerase